MTAINKKSNALRIMVIIASFVILVAGMKAAKVILVPFLLSVFISIITSSLLYWLNRKKIPMVISLLIVSLCLFGAGFLMVLLLKSSISDFTRSLPEYQEKLQTIIEPVSQWLSNFGLTDSDKQIREYINPGAAMGFTSWMLTSLKNLLSNSFIIVVTVIFILFEAAALPAKLNNALGRTRLTSGHLKEIMENINHYMVIKTYMSLGTGILVTIWLLIIGVDYPILWGALAFIFNFVPNIGSIFAAIPAVLLALVQLGPGAALLTAGGYLVFNVGISNFIEPKFMGSGLGISTLVVFLSLVFWNWVLGPVGMILSIPLTMTMKIALSCSEETSWISTLLGNGPPKKAEK